MTEINIINDETYENATGSIPYNLTNDYMFKATLQKSNEALLGIISALLRIEASCLEVYVTNPILLGRNKINKDFFLDIRVIVNNSKHLNLEMQVSDDGNWLERSVAYTSRMYDSLIAGEDYRTTPPVHHIGFINFNILNNSNNFYDTFALTNSSSIIYTDKFLISIVNLKNIDNATYEDKIYKLDKWARLITARTWEELKKIAKGDPFMEATARTLYELCQDFNTLENARRRKEYYAKLKKYDEQAAVLNEQAATINEQAATINEQTATISNLKAQLEALQSSQSI